MSAEVAMGLTLLVLFITANIAEQWQWRRHVRTEKQRRVRLSFPKDGR